MNLLEKLPAETHRLVSLPTDRLGE